MGKPHIGTRQGLHPLIPYQFWNRSKRNCNPNLQTTPGSGWFRVTPAGTSVPEPPKCLWGSPQVGGTLLGVPVVRIIVYWALCWGPPFGKLSYDDCLHFNGCSAETECRTTPLFADRHTGTSSDGMLARTHSLTPSSLVVSFPTVRS